MRKQKTRATTTAARRNRGMAAIMECLESRTLLTAAPIVPAPLIPAALASFQSGVGGTGGKPVGFVQDSVGDIFGVTSTGGVGGKGTVFEILAGSSTVRVLGSFTAASGTSPTGGLAVDANGDVFGTTTAGGVFNKGTVFEVVAGSGAVTAIASINGINGTATSGLVLDGNELVGTTSGGPLVVSTIFEVNVDTDTFTTLASLPIGVSLGGSLVMDTRGSTHLLFGTTTNGGASGRGTLFELTGGCSTINTVLSFDGTAGVPTGALTLDGAGNVFGTTTGGSSGNAELFEADVGTSGANATLTTLATFGNGTTPGSMLLVDGAGNLFGTTVVSGNVSGGGNGPVGGNATAFELTSGCSTFTTLGTFATTNGKPTGAVALSNGNLIGITQNGGSGGVGDLFTVSGGTISTTSSFTTVSANSTGSAPIGLIKDGSGNLFGVTAGGGTDNKGTVFEIVGGGATVTTLGSFTADSGFTPSGNIVVNSSGDVFGVTKTGGASGRGGIWELQAGSGAIVMLASFTSATGSPTGAIAIDDTSGNVFGTTSSEVFELDLGVGGATIHALKTAAKGTSYGNTLVVSGSDLIGTVVKGNGSVFSLSMDGVTYLEADPMPGTVGKLTGDIAVDADGNIFGTTSNGGQFGHGSVFEMTDVSATPDRLGSLTRAMGTATGNIFVDDSENVFLTSTGGSGQVLEFNNAKQELWDLASMAKASGTGPSGGLVLVGGDVLGTAKNGGAGNVGSIFDVSLASTETRLVISAAKNSVPGTLTADGTLAPVTVTLENPLGEVITGDTSAVTLSLVGTGTLAGTLTVNAVNGVATFSGLHAETSGTFQLKATVAGGIVPVVSSKFAVKAGAAVQIGFITVPTNEVTGQKFTVQVAIEDAFGNIVTNRSAQVTLNVTAGTGPLGGGIHGPLKVTTRNGLATFSNVAFTLIGTYGLTASTVSFGSVDSGNITVTGAPTQVVFTTVPTTTVAGVAFNVVAQLEDASGNVVMNNAPVTLSLANAHGAKLSGTTTVAAINGVVTFSGMSMTTAGAFTLQVTQGQAKGTAGIAVTAAAATKLKILTIFPSTSNSLLVGTNVGPVVVAVEDQFGNVVTGDTSNVTLTATGTALVEINGVLQLPAPASTVTVAAVNGLATFPAIAITKGFYNLVATDGVLKSDTLLTFVGFPKLA